MDDEHGPVFDETRSHNDFASRNEQSKREKPKAGAERFLFLSVLVIAWAVLFH